MEESDKKDFIIAEDDGGEKYLEKYTGKDSAVKIPGGIRYIGDDAFLLNKEVEEVTVCEGVDYIGSYAFSACTKLKKVSLPSTLQEINAEAFSDCKNLEEINLPKRLRIIGPEAFKGCPKLKIKEVPDFLIEVLYSSFDDTVSVLTSSAESKEGKKGYEVIDGIMYNNTSASLLFAVDKETETVKIKNGIKYLGWNCLSNLDNLKAVSIPDSVVYIGRGAFMFSSKLEKVIIPPSVKAIDTGAFFECTKLKEVIFQGNNLERICETAFAGCINLPTVTVPADCEIDDFTFVRDCKVKRREK